MAEPPHRARKRFGQNFLIDQRVIARIAAAINPGADDNLVEIGPGQGALTEHLLPLAPRLQAIELDRDLVAVLQAKFADYPGFRLRQGDALKTPFDQFADRPHDLRIVGNLPYNISTPLLFHLLNFRAKIADMHFLLQKEVVDRIAAAPGNKNYGRLSVMIQYHCRVETLMEVAPGAFRPIPKVNSALIRLLPHRQMAVSASDEAMFSQIVNTCFQQRRKTLRNSLKAFGDPARLADLAIDLGARPETLGVAQFIAIANQLSAPP
ncbi:MAG: 16S rRNA (adenine(1518)-N(6)/adenine(1519)-N(6))-dimethyltransferase RsmA [Porticoccaceae bacterium]